MTLPKNKMAEHPRHNRSIIAAFLFVATIFTAGILNSGPTYAASPVEIMVAKFGNQVLTILGNKDSVSQQKQQFRTVFLRNADISAIARFTLGKYARRMAPSQIKEYHKLLSRYIVQLFVVKMRGTQSTGLEVLSTTEPKKGLKYLVKSVINLRKVAGFSDSPIPVKWRIHRNDSGDLKLFDISIGGFWLAQEQRSTFVSIISRNKGKISALLAYLRNEIAEAS